MIFMAGIYYDVTPFVKQAELILAEANKLGITMRLLGAIAFHMKCPNYRYFHKEAKRGFTDVDFIAYLEQSNEIDKLFKSLGYQKDQNLDSVPGIRRAIFYSNEQQWHSDVFYDVLDFCHEINFKGRLELDYPTISLADLMLEKMQIVQINEKDIIDTLMLLREYDVGDNDRETINLEYLSDLMKSDWGLWKTFTYNLNLVQAKMNTYKFLKADDITNINNKIFKIIKRIESEPKKLSWKLRNKIGTRLKWYKDVDDIF
jgi:hypothetical protein